MKRTVPVFFCLAMLALPLGTAALTAEDVTLEQAGTLILAHTQ